MIDIRNQMEVILDVLDEKEWIQHHLFEGEDGSRGDESAVPLDEVTGVCLAGSYIYALRTGRLTGKDNWHFTSSVILEAVRDLFPDRPKNSIPGFNDHKDTTREDIILTIKTVIGNAM